MCVFAALAVLAAAFFMKKSVGNVVAALAALLGLVVIAVAMPTDYLERLDHEQPADVRLYAVTVPVVVFAVLFALFAIIACTLRFLSRYGLERPEREHSS